MFFIFYNSFYFYILQAFLLKIGSQQLQNDLIASGVVLFVGFLGFYQGNRRMVKDFEILKERDLIKYGILVTLLGGILIQYSLFYNFAIEQVDLRLQQIAYDPKALFQFKQYSQMVRLMLPAIFFYLFSKWSAIEFSLLHKYFGSKLSNLSLGMSYFGSLVSTLLFFTILVPRNYFLRDIWLLNIVNIVITVYLLFCFRKILFPKKAIIFLFIINISFTVFHLKQSKISQKMSNVLSLENSISNAIGILNGKIILQTMPTTYQRIDLLYDGIQTTRMYLDGAFQLDTASEGLYHNPFVLGAEYLNEIKISNPKILILGGGDGFLARKIQEVFPNSEVTLVELDLEVIRIGNSVFKKKNNGSLDKIPKIFIDDAFVFMMKEQQKFDLIFADFPDPQSLVLSKLYSKEFYNLCRKRLLPNGALIFDYPASLPIQVAVSTLLDGGFSRVVRFGKGHQFIYTDFRTEKLSAAEVDIKGIKLKFDEYQIESLDLSQVNTIFRPTLPSLYN